MFAVVAAGYPVQTEYQQVDATHIVFPLSNFELINHIVVFLAAAPLSDGIVGAVYFSLPSADGQPSWQYLGYVGNDKPSAIFRISKLRPKTEQVIDSVFSNYGSHSVVPVVRQNETALIGISLEPLENVKNLTLDDKVQASLAGKVVEFTWKMLENFSNYVGSFTVSHAEITSKPNNTETYIPTSAFNKWHENMQRRLSIDPNFWKVG